MQRKRMMNWGRLVGLLGLVGGAALAGGLLEPPGPPSDGVMKTLSEVEPRALITELHLQAVGEEREQILCKSRLRVR